MINIVKATYRVLTFEIRVFFAKNNTKFYMIENTSRLERIKMHKDVLDALGDVTGHERLRYFLDNFPVEINIYQVIVKNWIRIGSVKKSKDGIEIIRCKS